MGLKEIGEKRQKKWKESDLYKVREDTSKPKFYVLDMFPYPSGAALHVGHPKGYIATDTLARKKMLEGFNVLHPMGFDTFGLGTENYAIEHKMKPQDVAKQNVDKFIQQLKMFGMSYDRSRGINTADPKYFKRTQRIFLQLFNHYYDEKLKKAMPISELKLRIENGENVSYLSSFGKGGVPLAGEDLENFLNSQRLAYVDFKPINRCPSCMTGLANEDLDDGKCERCGSEVEQKPMKQWVLRITKYAERLLEGLDDLKWEESMKDLERNWIGKSEGTQFKMKIDLGYPTLNPSPLHGEGPKLPMVYTVGKNKLPSGDTMIELARNLRKKQTNAEALLWEIIRNKQVSGLKFRRQHPIGNYIADFYCPEKSLVIELDGSIHGKEEQKKHDKERDAIMKQHNINVIRFSNDDVFEKIEEVIQTIIDISNQSPLATQWRGAGGEVTSPLYLEVYTTRVDTVFGMSFVAIAPEHPLVDQITTSEHKAEVEKYKDAANKKTQLERTELQKDKTGVFCGAYAINPFNNEKVPVFVADYVLANYGTGVVMAVPAHDERDFEFAKKYELPMKHVIGPSIGERHPEAITKPSGYGVIYDKKTDSILVGSYQYNNKPSYFLPGGTIEEGESIVEGTLREITEETGFTDLHFENEICCAQSFYFADNKNEQRDNHLKYLLFTLNSETKQPKQLTEQETDYPIVWVKYEEFMNTTKDKYSPSLLDMIHRFITGKNGAYTAKGTLIDSGNFSGLTSDEAIKQMQKRLEQNNIGGKKVNFRMQDRVFSRQRYRGEPFPVLRDEKGNIVPLDENNLPLLLPDVDNYAPTGTTEGPLANITDRVNVTLPDGTKAKRETNTMPGRAGSSRYWLRYMDVNNDNALVGKDKEAYRGNVDVYVGGAEHITRHMIYGRFRQKFLYDIGVIAHDEPFQEYHYVGLIMGEDGRKMSKRRGNVVTPDGIISQFGADTLRTYEMFMGPFEQSIAWNTAGISGTKKFLDKVQNLFEKLQDLSSFAKEGDHEVGEDLKTKETKILLHQSIKKVSENIDEFKFNTAISQLMILTNHLTDIGTISRSTFETLVILISPFAPHLAEELWEQLGNEYSIFTKAKWPQYDEKYLVADTITMAVQINGKVRGTISLSPEAEESDAMAVAKSDEKIANRITGEPKKVIYVKGKILNIVI